MPRIRVTVPKLDDASEELRLAASVRRDIWAHSPVEIDPDNPLHGTHRDGERRAYFEFTTVYPEEVNRVLEEHGYSRTGVVAEPVNQSLGEACQNCGNIAGPHLPAVCPNCGFRDISPCPSCGQEIARSLYLAEGADVFACPSCHARVRLRLQSPVIRDDGAYNEPLIVVEIAVPLYGNR
jgi:DNA-directed RNA polymerase subunit RPC12/RpoP